MPPCSSYRVAISSQSPAKGYYDSLQKEGVTDAMLDTGVFVTDYQRVGEKGNLVGSGDCVVSEEETKEYIVENWKRFREPLEKATEEKLPWDFATDPQFKKFLQVVEEDLQGKKNAQNPSHYIEAKAMAVYWWFLFPQKKDWKIFSQVQKKEILEGAGELKSLGMKKTLRALEREGGLGNYYIHSMEPQMVPSKSTSFSFNFVFYSLQTYLYGNFLQAGIPASFVEVFRPRQLDPTKCGAGVLMDHGVGIYLDGKWRVFYPMEGDSHSEQFPFYPVSLSKHLDARMMGKGFGQLTEIMATKEKPSVTEDSNYYVRMIRQVVEKLKEDPKNIDWNLFIEDFHGNPLAYVALLSMQFSTFDEMDAIKKQNVRKAVEEAAGFPSSVKNLFSLFLCTLQKEDREKCVNQSKEAILKQDPKCPYALEVLAEVSGEKEDFLKAEAMYEEVENVTSKPGDHSQSFYIGWGEMLLKQKNYSKAIEIFKKSLGEEEMEPRKKCLRYMELGLAQAAMGEIPQALESLATAFQFAFQSDPKELDLLIGFWEDFADKNHLQTFLITDPNLRKSLGLIYQKWGECFFFHQEYQKAKAWYDKSMQLETTSALEWRLKEIGIREMPGSLSR